jgi:hypothetical protein
VTGMYHFHEIISVVLDLSTLLFSAWCRVSVVVSTNPYFPFGFFIYEYIIYCNTWNVKHITMLN